MSSSIDSGYSAQQASKNKRTKCKKSTDSKHKWKKMGMWPSSWEECTRCKEAIFWK
jgi:hypothetical protein